MNLLKNIRMTRNPKTNDTTLTTTWSNDSLVLDGMSRRLAHEIVTRIATRYVRENYKTLAKAIKPSEVTTAVTEEVAREVLRRMTKS